jgi:hypothetical protein
VKLKLSRDINGNKILKASFEHYRGFSVRTLGNMPHTHNMDKDDINYPVAVGELSAFVKMYDTDRQKCLIFFEFPYPD